MNLGSLILEPANPNGAFSKEDAFLSLYGLCRESITLAEMCLSGLDDIFDRLTMTTTEHAETHGLSQSDLVDFYGSVEKARIWFRKKTNQLKAEFGLNVLKLIECLGNLAERDFASDPSIAKVLQPALASSSEMIKVLGLKRKPDRKVFFHFSCAARDFIFLFETLGFYSLGECGYIFFRIAEDRLPEYWHSRGVPSPGVDYLVQVPMLLELHRTAPANPFPITPLQERILFELNGKALTKEALSYAVGNDGEGRQFYRKGGITELINRGWVANQRGIGYYRPDAKPPGFK